MHKTLGQRVALVAAVALVALAAALPAAALAYPSTTTSVYEHTAKRATTSAQGCNAAKRRETGVVILDYGRPAHRGDQYGTINFGGNFVWNGNIERAAEAYARGYVSCLPAGSTTHISVATGTSNSCTNHDPACCPRGCGSLPPSYMAAGRYWATWVRRLDGYLSSHSVNGIRLSSRVTASGADDAEPAWEPRYTYTYNWIKGYAATTGRRYPLWDFGSLESGYWNRAREYYVSFGAAPSVPMGEVYYSGNADNWEGLVLWSHYNEPKQIYVYGVTTQSNPPYTGCGFSAHGSYDSMLHALRSHSETYQQKIPYETDTPCYTA